MDKKDWINLSQDFEPPTIPTQTLPDEPVRVGVTEMPTAELEAILAGDERKAKKIRKLEARVAELEDRLRKQGDKYQDLVAETDRLRAKDRRLLPLGARRVLLWLGMFFGAIFALAILGAIVGPSQ